MMKKHLLIICILFSSVYLFAQVGVFISGSTSECTGYTGFLGTDSWTKHTKADVRTGLFFNEKWAAFLGVGADYNRELRSFTPFSGLSDSLSIRCSLGGKYSGDVFSVLLCGGLKVTDLAMDELNKYADIFVNLTGSAFILKKSDFSLAFDFPLSFSFNGYGSSCDIGMGVSLAYRVNFRGGK